MRLLTPSSLNYFKENNFTGPGSVILLFLSTNPCKLTSLGFPTPRLKTSVWMVTCGVGLTRSNKGGESIQVARCRLLVCHCWQGSCRHSSITLQSCHQQTCGRLLFWSSHRKREVTQFASLCLAVLLLHSNWSSQRDAILKYCCILQQALTAVCMN